MKKPKTKIEVMQKIISERQPIKISIVRQFALSYKCWKNSDKKEMYDFIENNFSVNDDDRLTSIR